MQVMMTYMSICKGIKIIGDKGNNQRQALMHKKRKIFLKEKCDSSIKAKGCADGISARTSYEGRYKFSNCIFGGFDVYISNRCEGMKICQSNRCPMSFSTCRHE